MKDLTEHALNVAKMARARYADIRIVERREQVVSVQNGNVDGVGDQDSQGFGGTDPLGNSWGFAASAHINRAEIERVTSLAVKVARASMLVPGEYVDLGPVISSTGRYTSPFEVDPFSISVEQKLDLLFRADA